MPARHAARLIARFMLVWFALYIGAAIASPMVHPVRAFELVCSGVGVARLIENGDAGERGTPGDAGDIGRQSGMDCPLCAPGAAPPPPRIALSALPAQEIAYAMRSIPAARIAARTAAPLPARGPPRMS